MKQDLLQQLTNIAWYFPTSSAARGQINQSRNSRAGAEGRGRENEWEWGVQERGEGERQR